MTLIVQSAYFARTEWNPQRAPRKPIRVPVILMNTLLGKPLRRRRTTCAFIRSEAISSVAFWPRLQGHRSKSLTFSK